jgi:hypothetical protein
MVCTGTVLSSITVGVESSSGGPHSFLFTRDFLQRLTWLGHVDECSPVLSVGLELCRISRTNLIGVHLMLKLIICRVAHPLLSLSLWHSA